MIWIDYLYSIGVNVLLFGFDEVLVDLILRMFKVFSWFLMNCDFWYSGLWESFRDLKFNKDVDSYWSWMM